METVDPSLKLPKGRGYAPPGMGKWGCSSVFKNVHLRW